MIYNVHRFWAAGNRSFKNSIKQNKTILWVSSLKALKKGDENQHHLYVRETTRSFETVRFEILESLKGFCLFRLQRI